MSEAEAELECLKKFQLTSQPAVTPWLRDNIIIPPKMSPRTPGPFRTIGRPFMEPILECGNPANGVNDCTLSAGTQILKSTILSLIVSYKIKFDPGPALVLGPSEAWTKLELSEKRIMALIEENPVLACEKPLNPDHFRALSMAMSGGQIVFAGSNSPTALAGGSYRNLFIDEASKITHQQSEDAPEDHPYFLALQRTSDFEEMAFRFDSSTPNVSTHPFWQRWEAGDQTHLYIPCPHCKKLFFFDFIGTKEERESYSDLLGKQVDDSYQSVTWNQNARDKQGLWLEQPVLDSAVYHCPHCNGPITDEDKPALIDQYELVRHNPDAPKNKRSWQIPSFYSPRIRIGRIAWQFLSSHQDFFGLQTLYNSWLAKPYELTKQHIKADAILKLKGTHRRRTIPSRPALIVFTADPGEIATHWMVTAIMPNLSLVIIDWGTVLSVNDFLDPNFLRARSYNLDGTAEQLYPQLGYIDSGYNTATTYDVCRSSHGFYWPTKGSNTRSGTWAEFGISSHPGLKGYAYVDHTAKTDLWAFRIAQGKGPAVIIPVDAELIEAGDGKGLIAGLTGQKLVTVSGSEVWKKLVHDHYADCLKEALVATWIARETFIKLGLNVLSLPMPMNANQ